jgi:hypothetical protein
MPTLQDVKPGDLITADLMNELMKSIKGLETKVGAGGNLVATPDVFGKLLGEARATLSAAGSSVTLGTVYDGSGVAIDALSAGNGSRRVLNQAPPGGQMTAPGSHVHLVVGPVMSGMTLSPSSATFTSPAPLTFTITNGAGQPTTGMPTVALSGADAGAFMIVSNNALMPLAGGMTATVIVGVNPTAGSSKHAVLSVSANPGGIVTATLATP